MSLLRQTIQPILQQNARRAFTSTAAAMREKLRIGYVPEHFSTPLYFAQKYHKLAADLIPYPSGTGHMVQSLGANEIDVGIGLTEGWVAGLAKHAASSSNSPQPYKFVGTYVETPLCWAISTGTKRTDINSIKDLRGKKIGVSRIGSGSYVMGFVLADQEGWLNEREMGFEPVVCDTFFKLREAVNDGTADFFMWEHFTSKKYYDIGEIRRVGEIYTPWSSWKIVATPSMQQKAALKEMFQAIDKGVKYFEDNQVEAVEYISSNLDYSKGDAEAWLGTVKFTDGMEGVSKNVIEKTVDILGKAGVLNKEKTVVDDMIFSKR